MEESPSDTFELFAARERYFFLSRAEIQLKPEIDFEKFPFDSKKLCFTANKVVFSVDKYLFSIKIIF